MTPIIVNLAKTAAHMYMRVRSFVLSSHSSYCCSNSPAGAGTYMHAVRSIKRAAAFTSHVTPPWVKRCIPRYAKNSSMTRLIVLDLTR